MYRPASKNAPQIETADTITGEIFMARTENHFEHNDGVPVAPAVDLPRKTLRERVEDLLYRSGGVMPQLLHDESDETDFDVPEAEDNGPMQPAEVRYILEEAAKAHSEAPGAVQPPPAPNPPAAGPNAPATSAAPPVAPQTPVPPAPTPGT